MTDKEIIKRLRVNILIHSYLYYVCDESVISNSLYDKMCNDLVDQQELLKEIGFYDEVFRDWDGSTGYHLPRDNYISNKAYYVLKLTEKFNAQSFTS